MATNPVFPHNLDAIFEFGTVISNKITLRPASNASPGVVQIDQAANTASTSDANPATTALVKALIAASITGLPADKYLASVAGYNAATNILTLNMSDGSTVPVDMTALISDAIASIGAATDTAPGIVELSTNAEAIAGTDTARAVTPAGLAATLAAPGVLPFIITDAFGVNQFRSGTL